jgi:hypothetical protein
LLFSDNLPYHRVLTAFAKHLTGGFEITDATELEDKEDPIPERLMVKMKQYGRLCDIAHIFDKIDDQCRFCLLFVIDCLTRNPLANELVQVLFNVVTRWMMGSQPTAIVLENGTSRLISLGIAHIRGKFTYGIENPVFIDEPLVVLSLSSLFQSRPSTTRKTWMMNSLSTARNAQSLGSIFEEFVMLLLLEKFGGRYTALGEVFDCTDSTLLSRKVTLVSLRKTADGVMETCRVAWNACGSDRFGYKANSPADVVEFLNDPKGIPFLFPDTHMGPDTICFFKAEEKKELIVGLFQEKLRGQSLDVATWIKAIDSVTPDLFYTVMVRSSPMSLPCKC